MMVFVPWVNDRYGRKTSIIVGNIIMVVGAVLQTASVNRMLGSIPKQQDMALTFVCMFV
jgi:fucose permease